MTSKKKEAANDKVERIKKLMVRIARHPDLTAAQKLGALGDMGSLVVQERFKEEEFVVLRECMEGLGNII